MNYKIKYGGCVTGKEEVDAIIKSVKNSSKTGNWQAASEAQKMEQEASKFLGVKYATLTTSGSAAGLLALSALELPKGSEVIIPATTFPTIFNIILQCGLTPVVVDSKIGTYNLDVKELEQAIGPNTRAIIAVHALGNPVDMPALMELVKDKNIYVIEDNCDGWGSSINGRMVGNFGHISFTSFHAAHIVSMGVGGGVFCNDSEIAKKIRMYRDWGRQADLGSPEKFGLPEDYNPRFIYEKIGYNFQILELQAAMGRVQLKKAKKVKKLRKRNFDYIYKRLFKYRDKLILPKVSPNADVCWFSFPITCVGFERGKLTAFLEKNGVETRSLFAGNICRHPAYTNTEYKVGTDLTEADEILKSSFWVSCHPRYSKKDLDYMLDLFDTFFNA